MKKPKRGKRVAAGSVNVLGTPVAVVLVGDDAQLTVGGSLCHGYYDPDKLEIVLDARESPEVRLSVFRHELGHAAFDRSGLDVRLRELLPTPAARRFEETLVDVFLPQYLDALASAEESFGEAAS